MSCSLRLEKKNPNVTHIQLLLWFFSLRGNPEVFSWNPSELFLFCLSSLLGAAKLGPNWTYLVCNQKTLAFSLLFSVRCLFRSTIVAEPKREKIGKNWTFFFSRLFPSPIKLTIHPFFLLLALHLDNTNFRFSRGKMTEICAKII